MVDIHINLYWFILSALEKKNHINDIVFDWGIWKLTDCEKEKLCWSRQTSLVELMADDHFSAGIFCASVINFYGYFLKQASFEFLDNFDF